MAPNINVIKEPIFAFAVNTGARSSFLKVKLGPTDFQNDHQYQNTMYFCQYGKSSPEEGLCLCFEKRMIVDVLKIKLNIYYSIIRVQKGVKMSFVKVKMALKVIFNIDSSYMVVTRPNDKCS